MAAKVSKLAQLHEMLTDMFMTNIEICKAEGIPMSAADMSVMVTFLKNNNITADVDDVKMQAIKEDFQDELEQARQKRAKELLSSIGDEGNITNVL